MRADLTNFENSIGEISRVDDSFEGPNSCGLDVGRVIQSQGATLEHFMGLAKEISGKTGKESNFLKPTSPEFAQDENEEDIESPNFVEEMRGIQEGLAVRLGEDATGVEGLQVIGPEAGGAAQIHGISLTVDLNNASQRRRRRRQVLNLASIQEENESSLQPGEGEETSQLDAEVESEIKAKMEVGAVLGIDLPPNSEILLRELIQSEKAEAGPASEAEEER